jgi:ubiquinone biosynthesis monooxygenase Coq7
MIPDDFIVAFDRALRTVFGPAQSVRPVPGANLPEAELNATQKAQAAALMRVNHVGEVCAQALYQGQALTARDSQAKAALAQAAEEEIEHLAWTQQRIAELGGRRSLLNPLWYAGSYLIGAASGLAGDRWNLGFLAETERQVVEHLQGHLERLSHQDAKSRAIIVAMKRDEARHATTALHSGGAELPFPFRAAMRIASRVMTTTAYWV